LALKKKKTKKESNFSALQHLAEAENLVGLEENTFQNFPHHNPWLRRKICLPLKKKNFRIFRTTTLA
jgi:hypothetical protein